MMILAVYIEERLACPLFQIVFESNRQTLEFLDSTMNDLYQGSLIIQYNVSKWKVNKVYKACFKWLTKKLDSFSINGVSFETLEQIYKSTVNNLSNDLEDSNNDVIKTIAYQFMQALNEKREDFMTNDSDYDDRHDELYRFDKKPSEERQNVNIDHIDAPHPTIDVEKIDEIKESIERQLITEAKQSENTEPVNFESLNNPMIENFTLGNEYKVVESRPKTTLELLSSIEDRKDVNFELSPSNTNSNSKHGKCS